MIYRRLEYTGGIHPFAGPGIAYFAEQIRKRKPGITDRGVSEVVARMIEQYDPRTDRRSVVLFGEDIMTEDPTSLPVWESLAGKIRQRVLAHPHDIGERIDPLAERAIEMERLETLPRAAVNRSFLIHPPLKQTYCWLKRSATPWTQEVRDDDYVVIMNDPVHRRLFQDPDIKGPYQDVRAYDYGNLAKERHVARDMSDVEALKRQYSRKHYTQGVTLVRQE